jgi:choice-of-anchor C domain-containing protein
MKRGAVAVLTASLALFGASATAATVTNGSFELPDIGGTFNGTSPSGWTVLGSVDLINTYWQAQDGGQSIDLSRSSPATISQSVSGFTIGQTYELSFWMSGNPDGPPPIKMLTASVGGTSVDFTFDSSTNSKADMGWLEKTFLFSATSETMLLSFQGTDNPGTAYGAALDNVSISAVPVPAAGLLLLGGLAAFGMFKRKRPTA